jgi:G3E family GTPase
VATRPEWLGEWHGAGDVYRFESNEKWYAEEPKENWDMKEESIMKDWEEPWGDRRQELVFIGIYSLSFSVCVSPHTHARARHSLACAGARTQDVEWTTRS